MYQIDFGLIGPQHRPRHLWRYDMRQCGTLHLFLFLVCLCLDQRFGLIEIGLCIFTIKTKKNWERNEIRNMESRKWYAWGLGIWAWQLALQIKREEFLFIKAFANWIFLFLVHSRSSNALTILCAHFMHYDRSCVPMSITTARKSVPNLFHKVECTYMCGAWHECASKFEDRLGKVPGRTNERTKKKLRATILAFTVVWSLAHHVA